MKSTYLYKIVKPHEQLIKFALSVVVHWPVDVFPLVSRRASTGLWTGQTHQNYSDKNCNISNCKALIINALDLFMLDIFRIFIV